MNNTEIILLLSVSILISMVLFVVFQKWFFHKNPIIESNIDFLTPISIVAFGLYLFMATQQTYDFLQFDDNHSFTEQLLYLLSVYGLATLWVLAIKWMAKLFKQLYLKISPETNANLLESAFILGLSIAFLYIFKNIVLEILPKSTDVIVF